MWVLISSWIALLLQLCEEGCWLGAPAGTASGAPSSALVAGLLWALLAQCRACTAEQWQACQSRHGPCDAQSLAPGQQDDRP